MNIKDPVCNAFRSLRTAWMRSSLTMFGIVLGVALTIIISGFAGKMDGAYQTRLDPLATSMGLTSGAPNSPKAVGIQSIFNSDVKALRQGLDPQLVSDVVPIASGTAMMRYEGTQFRATIVGSTPEWLNYKATPLVAGRMFTEDEYRTGARVAVIGPSVFSGLFNKDTNAALNSDIQVGRLTFRVIGILAHNATGNGGSIAVAPMTVVRSGLLGGNRTVGEVGIVMTNKDAVDPVNTQVSAILDPLRTPHKNNGLEEDFSTSTYQDSSTAVAMELVHALFWITCALIVLALIIGAAGLANLMMTSVSSRAKEIGVRRVCGARKRMIFAHFMSESIVIAAIGGIVGAVIGVVVVLIARSELPGIAPQFGVPELSTQFVVLAFLLSLLVGVVAGLHPSIRAVTYRLGDVLRN